MTKPSHAKALDILKRRNGDPSEVTLASDTVLRVYNIGWSYDLGNDVAYVTANDSPRPDVQHVTQSFFADEIIRIIDPDNGAILFEIAEGDKRERA